VPKSTISQSKSSGIPPGSVNGGGKFDLNELGSKPAAKHPSVTADFNFEELRAPSGPVIPEGPDLSDVTAQRPRGTEVIYVHPEWRFELYVIPPGRQEPFYAVKPDIAKKHLQICRKALIVPYADRSNQLFLWPILLENQSGSINEYSRSALARVEQGAGKWCQYEADLNKQKYRLIEAEVQQGAPDWPPEGLAYMVKCAFEDRIIGDSEHEKLRLRRGKVMP
jgi:hypothetical protein